MNVKPAGSHAAQTSSSAATQAADPKQFLKVLAGAIHRMGEHDEVDCQETIAKAFAGSGRMPPAGELAETAARYSNAMPAKARASVALAVFMEAIGRYPAGGDDKAESKSQAFQLAAGQVSAMADYLRMLPYAFGEQPGTDIAFQVCFAMRGRVDEDALRRAVGALSASASKALEPGLAILS